MLEVAKRRRSFAAAALLGALVTASAAVPDGAWAQERAAAERARAQELLDAEQPERALELLDGLLERQPADAQALLLRSTAHFLLGELEAGAADLEQAVRRDPSLRQAWLNLGGLRLSQSRFEAALAAFEKARELDPAALDNDLNLGAVRLFAGDLQPAARHFEDYLSRTPDPVEGNYLVATNYSVAGYATLALRHLEEAITRDGRVRLRVRTDPVFDPLLDDPRYHELMAVDRYQPAPGSHVARRSFETRYDAVEGKLLGAVVDALTRLGHPFDRRIEVTPDWALIWGETRIKLRNQDGRGVVELTAPPEAFTPQQWKERSERLLTQIAWELAPKVPRLER